MDLDLPSNIFSKNIENISKKIMDKVNNSEWEDLLNGLCCIKNNHILLDYTYFKYLATNETYNLILYYIITNIDKVLIMDPEFIIHVNMKNLTISDISKHKQFIQEISTLLKEKYPEKLGKCYVYNAPCIFSQIFGLVSMFIDKDTQKKIELIIK